jgi:hypothetical protein
MHSSSPPFVLHALSTSSSLNTEYQAKKEQKTADDSKCRICQQIHETVMHLMARRPAMYNTPLLGLHADTVARAGCDMGRFAWPPYISCDVWIFRDAARWTSPRSIKELSCVLRAYRRNRWRAGEWVVESVSSPFSAEQSSGIRRIECNIMASNVAVTLRLHRRLISRV